MKTKAKQRAQFASWFRPSPGGWWRVTGIFVAEADARRAVAALARRGEVAVLPYGELPLDRLAAGRAKTTSPRGLAT